MSWYGLAQSPVRFPLPVITTTSLPAATVGTPYSTTLTASGGIPPYTWRVLSDTPNTGNWLQINPLTGALSGTPGTAETESVTVQATDSGGLPTAPASFSLSVASGGPAPTLYPLTAISGVSNVNSYNNTSMPGPLGRYDLVMLSTYLGHEGAIGTTINAIFGSVKSAATTNGKTVKCLIYWLPQEQSPPGGAGLGGTFVNWTNQIQTANWWVRTAFPAGTIVNGDTATGLINICSQQNRLDSQSRTVWTAMMTYANDVLINGLAVSKYGEASNIAADPNCDGYLFDNQVCQITQSGSWSNGASVAASATTAQWIQQGNANSVAAMRAINPNAFITGNSNFYNFSTGALGGQITLDPSNFGLWDVAFCEDIAGLSFSMEQRGMDLQIMTNLIAAEPQLKSTGAHLYSFDGYNSGTLQAPVAHAFPASQGSWTTADYQAARRFAAMSCMRGAYTSLSSGGNYNPLAPLWLDEYQQAGGPANAFKWLGQASDGAQNAAWSNGIWRRQFQNGTVFWNPKGNGAKSNVAIGTTLNKLHTIGFGDPAVNNSATGITTISMNDGDGLFLRTF